MKVFISAVTSEFGRARDLLANSLQSRPIEVRVQRSFVHEHGTETLLDQLHSYIKGADRVVAVVGTRSGAFPAAEEIRPQYRALLPAGMDRASYTQWEVIFGLHYHPGSTKVHQAEPGYIPDRPEPGDDVAHQQVFVGFLTGKGLLRRPFGNADQLRANVWEEGWPDPIGRRPSNLPFGSIGTLFKGREGFLSDLAASFKAGSRAAAIHGMGGLGKTRAAVEYALARTQEFTALLFVSGKSPADIEAGLAALVGPLVLDLPEQAVAEQDRQVAAAVRWLQANPGWFLILDNVDEEEAARAAEAWVARLPGGQIVITTRIADWGAQVTPLELTLLSPEASVDLLLSSTPRRRPGPDDQAEAALLAVELGYLCLALVQAGANIDTRRLTLSAYRAEWEKNRSKLLTWHDERKMGYRLPVAVTWLTTIDQLSEPARQLLNQLSFLSHEPIPESLMDVVVDGDEAAAETRRAALDELARYSMAQRDAKDAQFSIHRLVQVVTREGLGAEEDQATEATILSLMRAALPLGNTGDVRTWPKFLPLVPHLETLARLTKTASPGLPPILNDLATFHKAKAQFSIAEPLYRRALEIDEARLGVDHSDVAIRLNNLATVLRATNRFVEAEPLYRRALKINEANYGTDHPFVATCLNNLAGLLRATSRLAEAEPLYRRALQIDEAVLGPEHPNVAIRLNNLAGLLQATNRLVEAEPLYRRALQISEATFGPDHPDVAICLNNLAALFRNTNRLTDAEPLYRRALRITEAHLGQDHPTVAIRLVNLAGLLRASNRLIEAAPLIRRALQIDEASYGQDHPEVATDLNNLAGLLLTTGQLAEAEPMYRRGILILLRFLKSTGHQHPNLNAGLNNYVRALVALKLPETEVQQRLRELYDEAGLPRPEGL